MLKNQSKNQKKEWQVIGKVMSAFFFISMFTIWPHLLKLIWPFFMNVSARIGKEDVWMFVIAGVGASTTSLILNNLFMYYVYSSKNSFYEQFRVNAQTPWPWQTDKNWNKKLKKTLFTVFTNAIVINFAITYGQSLLHKLQYKYSIQEWPTTIQTLINFSIFLIYNEVISYLAHLAAHHPLLYPIHKKHHQYNTTISLTATYAHPLEYVFSNLLSTALCIPLLSLVKTVHLATIIPWLYFRITQTIEVHSGYSFPWQCLTFIPSKNRADFHDFHHSHNSGALGSMFPFMDNLFGTSKDAEEYFKTNLNEKVKQ